VKTREKTKKEDIIALGQHRSNPGTLEENNADGVKAGEGRRGQSW
jgi:hypothetical protein